MALGVSPYRRTWGVAGALAVHWIFGGAVAAAAEQAPKAEAAVTSTAPPPALPRSDTSILGSVGIRAGLRAQDARDPSQLDQVTIDTLYLEPRVAGDLNRYVGWNASANVAVPGFEGFAQNPLRVLDVFVRFGLGDLFHLHLGRMVVPSDRTNVTGPFFISTWNYPGVYPQGWVGPKMGATGRDSGALVWGQAFGAKLKYYVGAFELIAPAATRPGHYPLWSGRVSVSLVGEEPGFYQTATYYGARNVVTLGLGLQLQENGAGTPEGQRDLRVLIADLLAEKRFGRAGTFTFEGAYYDFGPGQLTRRAFFLLASHLSAGELGVGRVQPLVRWQRTDQPDWDILDAFVTYVIHGFDLRVAVGYQRTDAGGPQIAHAIQFGVQVQQ